MTEPSTPSTPDVEAARRAEVGLCVLLAAADGDISEQEIGALSTRLGVLLGEEFSAIVLAMIVEEEISRMAALGPDRYVHTIVERLPEARRRRALRGALAVAFADGLAPEEEQMFRDVALELGIAREPADVMLEAVRSGAPSSR